MQPTSSAQALAQLQDTQKTAQDPNTLLSGQRQQLGVNAARDTVTGLRGAINNTTQLLQKVAPSVMGRTQNSLVTNAQSGRIIQNEQAPISQNLSDQTTKYGQASEDANRLEQEAQAAASGLYQGQQDKLSYAQNLYNALYKQEQDAADRAFAQQQFEAQQAAAKASAGSGGFDLTGGGAAGALSAAAPKAQGTTLSGGKTAADAYKAIQSLISTGSASAYVNTINAIQKSAKNGNTYDQAKLQILQQKSPGWFKNGSLNVQYLQNLAAHGLLKP